MDRWEIAILALALLCSHVCGQASRHDCDDTFVYLNQNTHAATAQSSFTTIQACQDGCFADTGCLTFNWNPNGATKCWFQYTTTEAYVRRVNSGITNYELPCRIPNQGCEYEYHMGKTPTDTGVEDSAAFQLNLCYNACHTSTTCVAFTWNEGGSPRCMLYDTCTSLTDSVGLVHTFKLLCKAWPLMEDRNDGTSPTETPVPSGTGAYPYQKVDCGIGESSGEFGVDEPESMTGDECSGRCSARSGCLGYDYHMDSGYCYLFMDLVKFCDAPSIQSAEDVYHVKYTSCPAPYPAATYTKP